MQEEASARLSPLKKVFVRRRRCKDKCKIVFAKEEVLCGGIDARRGQVQDCLR